MDKENLVALFILKCLFICYLGNEHYCTCYLNMNVIPKHFVKKKNELYKVIKKSQNYFVNIFYILELHRQGEEKCSIICVLLLTLATTMNGLA